MRAANRRSVGKVVVLRLRQRNAAGKVLGETASRPVRLTRAFRPVVVIGRLRAPGARIDIRVSAEERLVQDPHHPRGWAWTPT